MKKLFLAIFCSLLFFTSQANAQCPGGPDPVCAGTNGPCGSLHDGIVGQAYNDTMSFYAPNQVDAGSPFGMVDFVQFQLASVTGLPPGLTWSCGNGSCIYDPQPAGILTNFNVCGTPFAPGNYTLHVHIIGTVNIPGLGNQSGDQFYDIPLNILSLGGGNPVFSFTPSQGCDSATINFTPLINVPSPQVTEWLWDFGGGNTYNGQTPPPLDLNTPGIYPVTCTTNVYNLVLVNLNINVCGQSWWCGDIEELNCGNGNADLVPTFTTGTSNWTGAEVTDNCNSNWNGIYWPLTSLSYALSMVEVDVISQNDIPPLYSNSITGPGTYNFNSSGNYSGSFTIALSLVSQFIATDTIIVYTSPAIDTIDATAMSFCPYDSVTLSVYPGYYYEWYLNDTVTVQTGNDNTYTTSDAGSYTVMIVDPVSGCYVITPPIVITTLPALPPGFPNVGITESTPGTYSSILSGSYTYQWLYFDGNNYYPIAAPEGTASSYTPAFDGIYCLIATNSSGCLDTSNCIGYYAGVEDMASPFMANVYPNPTDGMINISLQNVNEDVTLNVYDMVGQTVYSVKILGTGSIQEMHDLTFLTKGIYLVELRNNQSRFTQKLIIR